MAEIRFIEINKDQLHALKVRNGQVILCSDIIPPEIYYDQSNGQRQQTNKLVILDNLDLGSIGDSTTAYYNKADSSFYIYQLGLWELVTDTSDLVYTLFEADELVAGILQKNNKRIAAVSMSTISYRPDGETVEEALDYLEYQVACELDPYYRNILIETNPQSVFNIPLPYKRFLTDGNLMTILVDAQVLPISEYSVAYETGVLTLNNPIFPGQQLNAIFHYLKNDMMIGQEIFTAAKDQVLFTFVNHTYQPGRNMVSLYVNGIKQPNQAFTEISSNQVKLNGIVPKNSNVLFEVGKIVPAKHEFFNFETKTTKTLANGSLVETFNYGDGAIREVTTSYDLSKRPILKIAKYNGVEVGRLTITYNADGSTTEVATT